MWLQKDFNHFIVLYTCFGKKKTFWNISFITTVELYFIATFQGTHLNKVFKTTQGVCSLAQNVGLPLWRQVMPSLKTNNLGKPSIKLSRFIFRLFIT